MLSLISCAVLSKENLLEEIFKLILSSPYISKTAKPGNFVHIKVSSNDYPLLRRAFSIHSVNEKEKSFEILFKVVGKGTEVLSKVAPGDTLDLLGPIGNTFSLPSRGKEIVLVAGGMGIAPLWFFLSRLIKTTEKMKLTFFFGVKNKKELLYVEEFKKIRTDLIVTTDDGSVGRKGLVTDVFLKAIRKKTDLQKLVVYSCGPQMMLQRMSEIAKSLDLSCQISLETHMACGVGACWGCVIKLNDGTCRRVCVDGPVFDAKEVKFSRSPCLAFA